MDPRGNTNDDDIVSCNTSTVHSASRGGHLLWVALCLVNPGPLSLLNSRCLLKRIAPKEIWVVYIGNTYVGKAGRAHSATQWTRGLKICITNLLFLHNADTLAFDFSLFQCAPLLLSASICSVNSWGRDSIRFLWSFTGHFNHGNIVHVSCAILSKRREIFLIVKNYARYQWHSLYSVGIFFYKTVCVVQLWKKLRRKIQSLFVVGFYWFDC